MILVCGFLALANPRCDCSPNGVPLIRGGAVFDVAGLNEIIALDRQSSDGQQAPRRNGNVEVWPLPAFSAMKPAYAG